MTSSTPDPGSRTRSVALAGVAFVATLLLLFGALNVIRRSDGGAVAAGASAATDRPTETRSATRAAPSTSASGAPGSPGISAVPGTSATPSTEVVLVGAGDIATCDGDGDSATASLIAGIAGTVFTAGDNAYPNGSADQFRDCYDPTWGQFRDRTRPAPGNHDWETADLSGYLGYFGSAAAPAGTSWYSYGLGAWHVVVLDSDCSMVRGCGSASPQGRWLAADLAASTAICTLAIWHHPMFSSGVHGNDAEVAPFWQALYDAGADVVINGHDHDYERFAPQDPTGRADRVHGIREFVIGTGGAPLRTFPSNAANSELRLSVAYGVIRLVLHPGSYEWSFIPATGHVTDSGSGPCH
ncbi:MAG: metallophosphoesterase [Chloroflexota bacterium]